MKINGSITSKNLEISSASGDIPIRLYQNDHDSSDTGILFIHGGGWIFGSEHTNRPFCEMIASEFGHTVVSVGYRLSPKYSYPAAFSDCYTIFRWMNNNTNSKYNDYDNINIIGASAGGNLGAAVSLLSTYTNEESVSNQFILYPILYPKFTDMFNDVGYLRRLFEPLIQLLWQSYLPSDVDPKCQYVSPPMSDEAERFPPTTVLTCGIDPLHREGKAFAEMLLERQNTCQYLHYKWLPHGFLTLTPILGSSRIHRILQSVKYGI